MNAAMEYKGSQDVALRVEGVGKEYKLYDSPGRRARALLTGKALHRSHWALHDVSFALHRGECLGVIGDNGAGKSTLLKLLAGTLHPSTGSISRDGRVTAILELGAGFHPEFSGRDNLYFGGSLIGIDAAQMRTLEAAIVAFAELGEALDRPVKTYSSGMTVRLAFALVTAVRPDVLIIDEALAVGDQSFQKKCIERILDFRRSGCTILFCSHSPYHIRHLCDRALWLVKGQVHALGETESVLAAYEAASRAGEEPGQSSGEHPQALPQQQAQAEAALSNKPHASDAAHLLSVDMPGLDAAQASADGLPILRGHDLELRFRAHVPNEAAPSFGFMLEQLNGVGITSVAMHTEGVKPVRQADGSWGMDLRFPELPLHTGDYVVSAYLFDETGLMVMDEWLRFRSLRFISDQPLPGIVHLPHRWEAP
ncbi:ABC transporter related [Delftia acidovorans SPH-1]|uniref:ABC transporter related n=1 Tax=Delftia acidovorans (strain DSM 14801 / SPH-1) TaxID=398578 RepID=A9BY23_DELAS|nr:MULTISPECIES: ABC transporter ATP-binding protein [Delftia]MBA4006182.1 ABC transporter ATP-binding protein [Delftia sp.]OLE93797.1 MAG: ABC transporter [Delftia sp. 13_1_40CM_3_66_6]ABX33958.1 ABC transporter related [Delftia acidovorans SPH-1]MCP4018727.1 ABC transporter ATP-binding protein [Delftia sp.]MCP4530593.1 ABC transporter ATP-binding protein [Delftia sp.]